MAVSIAVTLPRSAEHVGVARDLVAAGLRRFGAPDEVLDDMIVVVSEASSNVVHHALGSDEYYVIVELDEGTCSVTVSSPGHEFDSETAMPAELDDSGRGLALIRSMTDTMTVTHDAGSTKVSVTRRW